MRGKCLAILAVAVLVAAAIFLPERLLSWGDEQLLNQVQTEKRAEEREGFAESVQLTAAEKILLLRSGVLSAVSLGDEFFQGRYVNPASSSEMEVSMEIYTWDSVERYETDLTPAYGYSGKQSAGTPEEGGEERLPPGDEERIRLWKERARAVQSELRSLQSVGGLPQLWSTGTEIICIGAGDVLYMDTDTRMSFQAYQMALYGDPYDLDILVDEQSGRILSFHLRWMQNKLPNWGLRGASNFGAVWRDYWQMDSVSTGWYAGHVRSILEDVEQDLWSNGEYSSLGQISFLYNGSPVSIPLECRGSWSRPCALLWNR